MEIQDTKQPEHGDLATNWAMVALKSVASAPPRPSGEGEGGEGPKVANPRALGELLASELQRDPDFVKVEVAGPGFVNLSLAESVLADLVDQVNQRSDGSVLEDSAHFARPLQPTTSLPPSRINLEFVSVNPNGPITIGSGRGAAYGSTLANVLQVAGHEIHREYYINDGVNSEQMRLFAESVKALLTNQLIPENGYRGDYVSRIAQNSKSDPASIIESIRLAKSALAVEKARNAIVLNHFRFAREILVRQAFEWLFSLGDSLLPGHQDVDPDVADMMRRKDQRPTTSDWRPEDVIRFLDGLSKSIVRPQSGSDSLAYELTDKWRRAVRKSAGWLLEAEKPAHEEKRRLAVLESRLDSVMTILNSKPSIREQATALFGFGLDRLPTEVYQVLGQNLMIASQRKDLAAFGVTFDTWFSEQSLHDSGKVEQHIDAMIAARVADENPERTKLKLGKGGVIEEVIRESQSSAMEDDEHGELPEPPRPSGGEGIGGEGTLGHNTLWLRSTLFGDDMDRVLRRKDGRLTYIASDVAYHADKFNRPVNADKLITVLGPDHHGYINRLHAVVAAELMSETPPSPSRERAGDSANLGGAGEDWSSDQERDLYHNDLSLKARCLAARKLSDEKLTVQIFQLVRFMKDGKPAPMRKRDGNIYALIDLVNEIGVKVKPNGSKDEQQEAGKDVARFFYLMRNHDTTFDFDLDLAEKQSDENPVFYVQYAHARICSVLEKARVSQFNPAGAGAKKAPGIHPRERALILKIADLPHEIQRCAEDYGVNRLTTYAMELARTYHAFYDACRVIDSENPETTAWRLRLCEATKSALKATFDILGISAPERMARDSAEEAKAPAEPLP